MTDSNTILNNATSEINELLEKARDKAKVAFYEAVSMIFNDFPEVEMIQWTQYTPYFNDGDECIFSIGEIFFMPKNLPDDTLGDQSPTEFYNDLGGYDFDEYAFFTYSYRNVDPWQKPSDELKKAIETFENFAVASEEFLKDTFGDHVEVKVTRDGIEVTEFDHD